MDVIAAELADDDRPPCFFVKARQAKAVVVDDPVSNIGPTGSQASSAHFERWRCVLRLMSLPNLLNASGGQN
jgi:hypothetical protein